MNGDITRDPAFRSQYEEGVRLDPEFEMALAGCSTPRSFEMRPAPRPLTGEAQWVSTEVVRLR